MSRRFRTTALPLLAAAILWTAPPAGAAERKPSLPFAPGERLNYKVTLAGVEAGQASFALSRGASPGTWSLRAQGGTTSALAMLFDLGYSEDATFEPSGLLPVEVKRTSRERGREKTETATYDRKRGRVTKDGESRPLAGQARDAVTLLYALRAERSWKTGQRRLYPVNDMGDAYTVEVTCEARSGGLVRLKLAATGEGDRSRGAELSLALEDRGARRPVEIGLTLPLGQVLLRLDDRAAGL